MGPGVASSWQILHVATAAEHDEGMQRTMRALFGRLISAHIQAVAVPMCFKGVPPDPSSRLRVDLGKVAGAVAHHRSKVRMRCCLRQSRVPQSCLPVLREAPHAKHSHPNAHSEFAGKQARLFDATQSWST